MKALFKNIFKAKYLILPLHKKRSKVPIDVVIVTVDKDFDLLDAVIGGVNKNVKHPINKIVIISGKSDFIADYCKTKGLVFLDEIEVLGYSKDKIHYNFEGIDRSGWLYQQLLKFGYAYFSSSGHYLVVDSDTIFVKPRIFTDLKKTYFDYSPENHPPYRKAYRQLTGLDYERKVSFVAHTMLFEKTKLFKLFELIETRNKMKWDESIIANTDYSSASGFSEYETYGNFFLHFFKKEIRLIYWFNKSVNNFAELAKKQPVYVRSVSLHSYMRQDNK